MLRMTAARPQQNLRTYRVQPTTKVEMAVNFKTALPNSRLEGVSNRALDLGRQELSAGRPKIWRMVLGLPEATGAAV
jgi:hypothetical protein